VRISALVSDLADNPIVRAFPILKVLEKRYEVDVIGPCFGTRMFRAYEDALHFEIVEGCNYPKFIRKIKDIINHVSGDVLFAFKPKPTSYLIGLACSILKRIPIVLDIEDWELAPYLAQAGKLSRWEFFHRYMLHGWKAPNDFKYLYLAERLVPLCDEIFICSDFLRKKYGGIKLYHGVDTQAFNPRGLSRQRLRRKWGVPRDRKIVLFAGTVRPHKGIDDLVRALNIIDSKGKVNLLIVGGNVEGKIDSALYGLDSKRTLHLGYQPHAFMPEILHLSDLVVLPQKDNLMSRAQVPGKVFEAMAMAKPIIATSLSDLPEILEDCGIVIRPGDIEALARNIRNIIENPRIGSMMGAKAREKCMRLYSYEAMERILMPVFRRFEKRLRS
jgi:glycosyltransferase involved in cell wall biosynthesis